jgi:hypothetical protein
MDILLLICNLQRKSSFFFFFFFPSRSLLFVVMFTHNKPWYLKREKREKGDSTQSFFMLHVGLKEGDG